MPNRPGVQVLTSTLPTPRSAPTDSGTAFMAGLTDTGPLKPKLCFSLGDFTSFFGNRVAYSVLYDAVDAFFREGGDAVYISRVVGPAATTATKNFLDAGAGISLIVNAIGPGAWGANIQVAVLAPVGATGYRLQVTYNGVVVETSTDLQTQVDAVNWATNFSNYITVAIGASALVPVVIANQALVGGNDDRGNVTDVQWLNALNLFTTDLGPGQVLAPGRTTDVGHQQLCDHAQARNRVALLDGADTAVSATLITSATNAKATGNGQYGALFAPWIVMPGVVGSTSRTVPPSAVAAGLMARVDASDNPNTPAAGDKGQLRYGYALSQVAWDAATRQSLNDGGVNVFRTLFNGVRLYGYRSLADPTNNKPWLDFSNVRYLMWLAARCAAVGEQFLFDPIDGQGHTISDYGAALSAICQADWNAGIIYGNTAADAFSVDVSNNVNTPATIADNQLKANVAVRPDPFAELVTITIINVPITQGVS